MHKAGGNWVVGERFFDREAELEALAERVQDGTHTLLTAQRRMGKTSLVRELLRRLQDGGKYETIFVDLESATTPADAIAEIAFQSRAVRDIWSRVRGLFANVLPDAQVSARVPGIDLKVKLRAGVDAGNWRHKGDQIFAALANGDHQVVLALDELPILVNRLLKDDDNRITTEGKRTADEFLSWLRKNGQEHRQISMILSGSVSLEPILQQAGLSAHANIFPAFHLRPWDEKTAVACLEALAKTYHLDLPTAVCKEMCRRLRCRIPHHVQRFFDAVHEHLRHADRRAASVDDIAYVYDNEMLGVQGQMDMAHYEERLRSVLGDEAYRAAFEMLKEAAATHGRLSGDVIAQQRDLQAADHSPVRIDDVLHVLEHDGYLAREGDGYHFVSGLLEDWWRVRYPSPSAETAGSTPR